MIRNAATSDLQPLFALYGARRFGDMERLAEALLARFPQDGNVWKALSVAQQVQGKDAVPALQKAIALLPRDFELPSNLGALLSDAGRLEEAIGSYRRALSIKPDFADAHGNLGVALNRLGRHEEAVASLQRALRLKPSFAEAHNNLASAFIGLGRPDDALPHYERALLLRPDFAQARRGHAQALRALGRMEDAAASYRLALALQPGIAELHFNLADVLAEAGQLDEAIAAFREALALDPGAPAVLNNLGNALMAHGQPEEALAHYRRAIVLAPGDPQARYNLARALRQLGRFDEALDHFRQLVAHDPDNFAARSDMLFVQNYMDCRSDAALLDDARAFGALASARAQPYRDWPRPQRRALRVGLVSGDLREHPVGYFAQGVLAALAAQTTHPVQLLVYANTRVDDAVSHRIRACCEGWRRIDALDDAAAAAQIHADGIDILIDLAGHTARNRLPLFAWRPAPVQVAWLGYCASTGMAEIDHVLVDPWIAPQGTEAQYVEHLWRLPETFLCFTPPDADIPVAPLPALANDGRITFGCFNNLSKLNPAVIALWSRVLAAVPASRLFLKAPQLGAEANRLALSAQFGAHGIAAERLLFEGATARAAYLSAYNRVDIALDPFPYPGGTTSVEGAWMGVPILSLAGRRALGRQGESILCNLDLAAWIAQDADDFVARAVHHASDPAALADLRAGLRARLLASPLCDAPRFAGYLAGALHAMWGRRTQRSVVNLSTVG
jgi:predicted O-linked N-acetylglucosamine transferase (SPINDLY family)